MAGHSKWANIQHRKGRQDKARAKLFSRLSKEIMVAVKMGGPDPDMNPRLRLAVQNAKGQSMPKDNIERAINKAAGGDAEEYFEIRYEGFGPAGIGLPPGVLGLPQFVKDRAPLPLPTGAERRRNPLHVVDDLEYTDLLE